MYLEERIKRLELEKRVNELESKMSKKFDVVTLLEQKAINEMFSIYTQNEIPKGFIIDSKYKTNWLMFMTITFDPAMFGTIIDNQKEQDYILYTIKDLKERLCITNVYGSFELHKNGRIHAHLMLYTYGNDVPYVKGLFGKYYSKRAQQIAVDCEVVRNIEKTKAYIDKEPYPKTWFTYGNDWKNES